MRRSGNDWGFYFVFTLTSLIFQANSDMLAKILSPFLSAPVIQFVLLLIFNLASHFSAPTLPHLTSLLLSRGVKLCIWQFSFTYSFFYTEWKAGCVITSLSPCLACILSFPELADKVCCSAANSGFPFEWSAYNCNEKKNSEQGRFSASVPRLPDMHH